MPLRVRPVRITPDLARVLSGPGSAGCFARTAVGTLMHDESGGRATTMSVRLDHTIVAAADKAGAAQWLADILGLSVVPQHYAFLVSEQDFDTIFERLRHAGVRYYAGPGHQQPDQINHKDGGRGTYFDDPDGHSIEIITRPYGSGG